MTFQQLTYVVEISRCGSINKAAHKLFLSQSGISSAVRELEEELGIQFFVRSNRGVEFTPEGKEFLSYAVSLLEQKQRIESLYGEGRDAAAPARFSVSTQRYPFTEDAFLRMLRTAEDNRYRYSIKETGMDAVIDDVYDHRADVGVIFLTELTEKMIRRLLDARGLEFHEVAAVSPCVYVRKGHPLAGRTRISMEDLEPYPCLSFEQGQYNSFYFAEEVLSTYDYKRSIKVSDRATILNLMVGLCGYTLCSGIICEELNGSDYCAVLLEGEETMTIGYLKRKGAALSPLGQKYLEELEKVLV